MSDYIPPDSEAVNFVFTASPYTPPQPLLVVFDFSQDSTPVDPSAPALAARKMNFTLLMTF